MNRTAYNSPLGEIILSQENGALTGLWFRGQRYECRTLPENTDTVPLDSEQVFLAAAGWLDKYFSGERAELDFCLAPKGTRFQQKVWRALLEIAYGTTKSYGEIAGEIGCRSPRAVGSAIGRNPISIIIPCHRVVGADGSMTGYAGGTDRKRYLLRLEGVMSD